MQQARQRYSSLLAAVHWLTALCVVVAYLLSEGGRRVRLDPPQWHFFIGLAVLLLLVPRLIGRALGGAPPMVAGDRRMQLAAKAGHGLLYLLLVAVPVTGWLAVSKLGVPVSMGGINVPLFGQPVQGNPGLIGDLHQWGGNAILIIAGLHALAALWHQFYLKDGTLARMRPF